MVNEILNDLLESEEDDSFKEILRDLLDETNLDMKTEINKPMALSKFETMGHWAKLENMVKSASIIEFFAHRFRVNNVSKNRQSRKEIIQALTSVVNEERTVSEKLTEKPK